MPQLTGFRATYREVIDAVRQELSGIGADELSGVEAGTIKRLILDAERSISHRRAVQLPYNLRVTADQGSYPFADRGKVLTLVPTAGGIIVTVEGGGADLAHLDGVYVDGLPSTIIGAADGHYFVVKTDTETVLDGEIVAAIEAGGMLLTKGIYASGATNETPVQVSSLVPHEFSTGDNVIGEGFLGNTAPNAPGTVTVVDEYTVSLDGLAGNGNYTGGGKLYRLPVAGEVTGSYLGGARLNLDSELPRYLRDVKLGQRTWSGITSPVERINLEQEVRVAEFSQFPGSYIAANSPECVTVVDSPYGRSARFLGPPQEDGWVYLVGVLGVQPALYATATVDSLMHLPQDYVEPVKAFVRWKLLSGTPGKGREALIANREFEEQFELAKRSQTPQVRIHVKGYNG